MSRRPDIVCIMTDEQRFDWIGACSDGHFETPNIDALAASGVRFDAGYSASPTCQPSRASLLTGRHHHRLPLQDGSLALREGVWTIARAMRDAGYETAMIGRMHLAPIRADHGFETMRMCENINPGSGYRGTDVDDYARWLESEGRQDWRQVSPTPDGGVKAWLAGEPRVWPDDASTHPTAWIERETRSFLQGRDQSRPLFLIVSFPHPHAPYDPPEPYASMYDPADAELPTDGFEVNDGASEAMRSELLRVGTEFRTDTMGEDLVRRCLTSIRALVKQIDDAVGAILEDVDVDDSLIVFTSDHGDYGGHRGLLTKVPWIPYEDLIRVPLVVSGGAVAGPGRVCELPVQNASFAATALDYAGAALPDDAFDFPSLRGILDGTSDPDPERPVFSSFSMGYPTVRRGRYKLICTLRPDLALFDLLDDPGETRNLAEDPAHAEIAAELLALLREEFRTAPATDLPAEEGTLSPSPAGTALTWTDHASFSVHGTGFRCMGMMDTWYGSTPELFSIFKPRDHVERYARLLTDLAPERILELGILKGGSTALMALLARPSRMLAVDLRPDRIDALDHLLAAEGLSEQVQARYGVDQGDRAQLAALLDDVFGTDELDLVVDDGAPTRVATEATFELTWPRIRPGGLYVLERWRVPPLRLLVVEQFLAFDGGVADIEVNPAWVALRRNDQPLDRDAFALRDHVPAPLRAGLGQLIDSWPPKKGPAAWPARSDART